jgi:hypothetical protein
MHDVELRTTAGEAVRVPAAELEGLAGSLGGQVSLPGEPVYRECCDLWNAEVAPRPALVVRCAGPADVARTLRLASRHGLRVSVRSGGHNIAGGALCDGGLTIDLSQMRGVRVDPAARTVRAQAGARWMDVDRETQLHGLAVPAGIVSTTGIAGLTLGGGFGWLTRKHGLTCDHLLSADVVTPGGELVVAGPGGDEELLWALRGGGGNFGVVTSFEYRAHPVGPEVLGGLRLWRAERGPEVARFFRRFAAAAPPELGLLLMQRFAPPAPWIPAGLHGAAVVGIGVCWAGEAGDGRRVLAALDELGEPAVDAIAPKPYTAVQGMLDATQPPGRRYYWKSEYLDELGDDLIPELLSWGRELSSPLSAILVMRLGGAARDEPPGGAAARNRDAEFIVNIASSWTEEGEGGRHVEWTRGAWERLLPFSSGGTYVNFLTADDPADRLRAAFGTSYDRLLELKRRCDPDGMLHTRPELPVGRAAA